MCSYGSFAKTGGAGYGLLRSKSEQKKDLPRRLSTKEKRLGVSLRKADVAFVAACKSGLVDSVGDILAHEEGDARHISSIDVVVRSGGRAQTSRLTTALHEAARGGHADVCAVLLNAGANPRMTLELGRVLTALHVARTPATAQILLDGHAPSRYRQTLRSDSRIPDPSWYQRAQNRPQVAAVIDAFNEELLKRRGRRVAARSRLQMIWQRLQGMVIGIRFIRQYQIAWKERFYDPENGAFMRGIGAERFAFYAGRGDSTDSDEERSLGGEAHADGGGDNQQLHHHHQHQQQDQQQQQQQGHLTCLGATALEFAAGNGVAAVQSIRRRKGTLNENHLRISPKKLAVLVLAELKSRVFEGLSLRV